METIWQDLVFIKEISKHQGMFYFMYNIQDILLITK